MKQSRQNDTNKKASTNPAEPTSPTVTPDPLTAPASVANTADLNKVPATPSPSNIKPEPEKTKGKKDAKDDEDQEASASKKAKVGQEKKEDKKKEKDFSGDSWLTVMKKIMDDMDKDPAITKEHRQKAMDKAKETFSETYKAFKSTLQPLLSTKRPHEDINKEAEKIEAKSAAKKEQAKAEAPSKDMEETPAPDTKPKLG